MQHGQQVAEFKIPLRILNACDSYEFYLRCFSEDSIISQKISLVDPVSMQVIKEPCRGLDCTHLQCFDVRVFFQMNSGKQVEDYKCHICGNLTNHEKIYVDYIAFSLLKHHPSIRDLKLHRNGHIEAVTSPKDTNLGSAAKCSFSNFDDLFQSFLSKTPDASIQNTITWEELGRVGVPDVVNFLNTATESQLLELPHFKPKFYEALKMRAPFRTNSLEILEDSLRAAMSLSKRVNIFL